jgi:hypothetical protein
MRKKALIVLGGLIIALATASPAAAQPSGNTSVTFTVGTSNLTIEVPPSVNLGSGFAGSTISGQLGNVTVTDNRAALTATWTASVTSTAFTTGTGTPEETIAPNFVNYWSGPLVSSTGTGIFVPGQPTQAAQQSLEVPRVAFSKTTGSGNNSAVWSPTLNITIPVTAVGGLYQGTVTHSVA